MTAPQDQLTIGVVGAGTMGSGIALTALYAGIPVVVQDSIPEALDRARSHVETFLTKKGQLNRLDLARFSPDLHDLAGCGVVIEAIVEDLSAKQQLFRRLEDVCGPDAILATNTSTLSVTAIAAAAAHPGRVAGMHFFNPAPVLPLVEIVRGAQTSAETADRLTALARTLGKTPVSAGDTPGFIVNRIARPYYGEALRLLGEQVCSHAEIDLALRQGAGFRQGPFELMDLIGIDINATAMKSMHEQTAGEPRYRPHWIQLQKMASGDLGRKTGRGFYDYRGGDSGILTITPPDAGGGSGEILFYGGLWTCGFDRVLRAGGYRPDPFPKSVDQPAAVVVTEAHHRDLAAELERIDWMLPEAVPVFVQCLDSTLEEHLPLAALKGRFIGFDPLFLTNGRVATLVAGPGVQEEVRRRAEEIIRSLGLIPLWVSDSPALVLPRVVAMLINEAAFAVQEGVAAPDEIDLAMQLGVNYPQGLLAWGRSIGWSRVLAILEHLQREFGEDRYRPCQLIRRWAREEARAAAIQAAGRREA